MTYCDILIAERWQESRKQIARVIVRKENKIEDYKKQDNRKEQYLVAMEREVNQLKDFLTNTDLVIAAQAEILANSNQVKIRAIELEEQNFILKQYLEKTGMDTSLFQWMTRRDFYNY